MDNYNVQSDDKCKSEVTTDPRPIGAWIKEIRNGNRPCISCGQFIIGKDEPEWKLQCENCWQEKKEIKYCRHCGQEIEKYRIDFAKSNGGQAKQCHACATFKEKNKCSKCGLLHPVDWKYSPNHP